MATHYSHQLFIEVNNLIEQGKINVALQYYLENHINIPAKGTLEKHLLIAVLNTKEPIVWINRLINKKIQRLSYLGLVFTIAQVSQTELDLFPLPSHLASSTILPLLSKAWQRYPSCNCLKDKATRKTFIQALQKHPEALGWCVLSLAECQDFNSLEDIFQKWITYGLYYQDTPIQIKELCQHTSSGNIKTKLYSTIQLSFTIFRNNKEALLLLLQSAFKLIDIYDSAKEKQILGSMLACSERLFHFSLHEHEKQQIISLRLAALAELAYDNTQYGTQLVEEYKSRWQVKSWHYPYPERLLFIFQRMGAIKQENLLLSTAKISSTTPKWVRLTQELLLKKRPFVDIMNDWDTLREQNRQDETILIGMTRSLVSVDESRREQWAKQIQSTWLELSTFNEHYYRMAHGFLVQMQASDIEKIEWFKKHLYHEPLTNTAIHRAVRLYLRALRNRRDWAGIRQYMEQDMSHQIHRIIPFAEYAFMHVMAEIDKSLPRNKEEAVQWYRLWENVISLPLKTEALIDMIAFFNSCQQQLNKYLDMDNSIYILNNDIRLQILRHGKARAEYMIITNQNTITPHKADQLKQHLQSSNIYDITDLLKSIQY